MFAPLGVLGPIFAKSNRLPPSHRPCDQHVAGWCGLPRVAKPARGNGPPRTSSLSRSPAPLDHCKLAAWLPCGASGAHEELCRQQVSRLQPRGAASTAMGESAPLVQQSLPKRSSSVNRYSNKGEVSMPLGDGGSYFFLSNIIAGEAQRAPAELPRSGHLSAKLRRGRGRDGAHMSRPWREHPASLKSPCPTGPGMLALPMAFQVRTRREPSPPHALPAASGGPGGLLLGRHPAPPPQERRSPRAALNGFQRAGTGTRRVQRPLAHGLWPAGAIAPDMAQGWQPRALDRAPPRRH